MSTQVLETNLRLIRSDLVEYINDEIFDMLDEFKGDEIADCVLAIVSRLMLPAKVVEQSLACCDIWHYQIKVNNNLKGWVSVSCEETGTTGVSHTEYYPFFNDEEDGYFAGLCSLASMINEAWYLCNN